MSILDKIIEEKRRELTERKAARSVEELQRLAGAQPAAVGFVKSLEQTPQPSIIAEVKRASPSKGIIRADLEPVHTALAYGEHGAACISVLTDKSFFSGEDSYIEQIRSAQSEKRTPILRKEFIIDTFQVWETRALGADALLLIVAVLTEASLLELATEAQKADLDILVEVHNEHELTLAVKVLEALDLDATRAALGINNRDLNTFVTSLETTRVLANVARSLLKSFSGRVPLVAESGISNANDLKLLRSYGADAFLIGESLVREGDPGENLARLISEFQKTEEDAACA